MTGNFMSKKRAISGPLGAFLLVMTFLLLAFASAVPSVFLFLFICFGENHWDTTRTVQGCNFMVGSSQFMAIVLGTRN